MKTKNNNKKISTEYPQPNWDHKINFQTKYEAFLSKCFKVNVRTVSWLCWVSFSLVY